MLAASLFALMPSHAEPVAWISGRVDSLASLFYPGGVPVFRQVPSRESPCPGCWAAHLHVRAVCEAVRIVTFPAARSCIRFAPARVSWCTPPGSLVRLWPRMLFFIVCGVVPPLRHALFGNALREDRLTGSIIEEFFYRQNRYVRELLPTPPPRAPSPMRLAADVLIVGALAACVMLGARRRPGLSARGATLCSSLARGGG